MPSLQAACSAHPQYILAMMRNVAMQNKDMNEMTGAAIRGWICAVDFEDAVKFMVTVTCLQLIYHQMLIWCN